MRFPRAFGSVSDGLVWWPYHPGNSLTHDMGCGTRDRKLRLGTRNRPANKLALGDRQFAHHPSTQRETQEKAREVVIPEEDNAFLYSLEAD